MFENEGTILYGKWVIFIQNTCFDNILSEASVQKLHVKGPWKFLKIKEEAKMWNFMWNVWDFHINCVICEMCCEFYMVNVLFSYKKNVCKTKVQFYMENEWFPYKIECSF